MSNTFKNAGLDLTTNEQTIYTTPADTEAVVHAIYLTNIAEGHQALATVIVNDVSESRGYKILYRAPVRPGSTLIFDKPVNLEAGDSLKVLASDDDLMTAFISVLEVS